ncbi:right-handed parallel beta-helix repeat-containing protein [Campylobacter upsaliensis]|nr:right-handed parallel beta-helix repeat-containing protein [Campylobacter upsaliensis]
MQDLRSKYDGALVKIGEANEACKTELESKKTEALEALEASKSEQGIKIAALEGKMQELKSRFITDDNQILIKVGNNADEGEIASLKEALNLALKYAPSIPQSVTREKNRVIVEIQEGWEWVEAIGLYHIDLSHIILTQKNFDVPIMCDFSRENMHSDNGLLVKLYLDNSKISIKKLHLKAKAKELTENNCWFNNYIYSRFGSEVFIEHLKLDSSLLTTANCGQAGDYTIFTDDGSQLLAHKIEIIKSAATNEGFCVRENSRAYIEHLILSGGNNNYNGVHINTASSAHIGNITIQGNSGHNGVFINAASSAYIANITISGNSGHNGVFINAASSAYIANITISGNSGHNGVFINAASSAYIGNITISSRSAHQHLLVDGSRLINHGSCNFTGGSAGNNQKLAVVRGGLATVAGNGYSRGAGNDANQAVGVWSAHGSWCFYGNRT